MDIARALYQGGEIFYADNFLLSYISYTALGLRCLFCGEPVFFKSGYEKKSHFSHFPNLSNRQLEECTLRQNSYGYGSGWRSLVDGKGQRLEIFQAQFLSIVSRHISTYYVLIKQVREEIEEQLLIETTNEIYRYFCSQQRFAVQKCHDFLPKDSEEYPMRLQVICEAMDYLAVLSSAAVAKELIRYGIATALEKESIELKAEISEAHVEQVYSSIIEILAKTPWIASFGGLNQKRKRTLNTSKTEATNERELRREDRIRKSNILLSQDVAQEFSKAVLTHQYSSSPKFVLDSAHHILKITVDHDIELRTITNDGAIEANEKLCKYISLTEEDSVDLSWSPTCGKYKSLALILNTEDLHERNINIIKNPHYRQTSGLPQYLAHWRDDKNLEQETIVAVGYSNSTRKFLS